jgi:hypothetical protein
MTLPYGTTVRSLRGHIYVGADAPPQKNGIVVGYGVIQWPTGDNTSGDGGVPQPVYLVQFAEGSKWGQVACVVMRADMVEEAQ